MIDPQKIWTSAQLPSLPTVALKLLEVSRDPESGISEIVSAIKSDPAIAAKILKLANSSYFAVSTKVTSIDRAVPLLGTTVIASVAFNFSLVDAAMTRGRMADHYNAYWMQSVIQGAAAELLCGRCTDGVNSEYFLSGLLVGLGRLAMLKTIPEQYMPVLAAADDQQRDLHEVESEMLGVNHIEVGWRLMEHWNLPESLVRIVQFHRAPVAELREMEGEPDFDLLRTIAVSASVGDCYCTQNKGRALERLQSLTSALFGFSNSDLRQLVTQTKDRFEETRHLFSLKAEELGDPTEMMAQANDHLAQLTMREHVTSTQAVARQQATEREKQELETRNQQLKKQALYDQLTGIYNRHFFDETLLRESQHSCRNCTSIGVIFADIDKFKLLNDTYGHPFGDAVLKQVAQTVKDVLRQSDVLARFGGEEFVILAIQPTESGLAKVAERICECVEKIEISFENEPVSVTISVGAAVALPQRTDADLDSRLIAAADEAMYESKQNGRNQVHFRSLINDGQKRVMQQATRKRFSRWLVTRNILEIPAISKVLLDCRPNRIQIGALARQFGWLNIDEISQILQDQSQSHERFGEVAMRLGLLTEEQLIQLLAQQQEQPEMLGELLVSRGLLEEGRLEELLEEYLSEFPPTQKAVAALE